MQGEIGFIFYNCYRQIVPVGQLNKFLVFSP
jgi:hypothetical protein